MANRTVSVELTLKTEQYKAEAEAAKLKTEELDRKVEALDKDINKIPADAAKAAAALDVMGAGARSAADGTGKLDARITELKTSVKDLGSEFDRTGDPALLKKFRSDSSELAGLTRMRKEFEDSKPALEKLNNETDHGSSVWSKFTGMITSGRQALLEFGNDAKQVEGPFAGGLTSPVALGVGAAAAGPALAAAGGLIGALGGAAGAGLGIYGAVLGNPEAFKSAWSGATNEVKKDLIDAGAAFTGPALAEIKTIGPTVDSWHLDKALAPAAKYVPMIASGLEKAATGFEHGFADLVANAGPEVQALSDGMGQFGQAVGTAFSEIASGSQGGAQALHDTITLVSDLTVALGATTGAAEKAFGAIHDHPILAAIGSGGLTIPISIWDGIAGSAGKAADATNTAGDAAVKAQDDFAALGKKLTETKVDADSYAETMSTKILDTTMSLDQATLHFDESLTKVKDSLKQNGKSLDEHTAKGQANVSAILAGVQANISAYKANVQAGMGAEQAAAKYDEGTAALEKQLRQSGLTQASIDGLIGKYKGVPKNVDTNIAINGLTDAINSLGDLIAQLNHIDGHNYHSTVTTDYIDNRKSVTGSQVPSYSNPGPPTPHHDPHPHAAGGILDPGWNIVGEEGIEAIYNSGGQQQVFTTAKTRSMMASSSWGGSGGGGTVVVSVEAGRNANLTPLGTLINQMLRNGDIVVKASQVRAG